MRGRTRLASRCVGLTPDRSSVWRVGLHRPMADKRLRCGALALVVFCVGAACGDDDEPTDAGSAADRASPVDTGAADRDSGHVICALPGGGECHQGDTCETGTCPDGTPVTCVCLPDGTLGRCTGACPPDDAGAPALDAATADAEVDASHGH